MKKIALFGGAFNPPHIGHTEIIKLVARHFDCDEVWIMPSADRHDKIIPIPAEDRLTMIELMIKDHCQDVTKPIVISTFELEQKKPTLTYETKCALEQMHPEDQFYFVMGSDIVRDMKETWIMGKELFETANFILLQRAGSHTLDSVELPKNHIFINDSSIPVISSTLIRKMISDEDLTKYTSLNVAEFIKSKKLYS